MCDYCYSQHVCVSVLHYQFHYLFRAKVSSSFKYLISIYSIKLCSTYNIFGKTNASDIKLEHINYTFLDTLILWNDYRIISCGMRKLWAQILSCSAYIYKLRKIWFNFNMTSFPLNKEFKIIFLVLILFPHVSISVYFIFFHITFPFLISSPHSSLLCLLSSISCLLYVYVFLRDRFSLTPE